MSNLIFTDEVLRQITQPESLYFRSYFKYLAQEDNLKERRSLLEKYILYYSGSKRDKVIRDLQSSIKTETLSTISEVLACGILKENFNDVVIEEPLDLVNGKTPDFWVDKKFAVEVLTIFDIRNPFFYSITETINSIPSELKVILGVIHDYPDSNPKLREIRNYFETLFHDNQSLTQPTTFFYRFSDDLLLHGHLVRGSMSTPTLFTAIEGHGFDELNDPNYYKSCRSRIKSKLNKYKNLTNRGFPLILAIYNNNQWLDNDDFEQIVFGDKEYILDLNTGKPTGLIRKDGIIRTNMNTTLSAILLKNDQIDQGYQLIKNPHARVSIDAIEDDIKKAFKINPA